jgi:Holliday junction resolvasome RuvABC endonuclease subunit
MILGIDISTSCTGFCVLNSEGKAIHFSCVELSKEKNFNKKVENVRIKISNILKDYEIQDIVVEESLQSFRRGLSSAATLFKLAKFNGIIQWLCYDNFQMITTAINVNTARKLNNIKVNKKLDKSIKDQVLDVVKEHVGDSFSFPMKTLKSGPRKGQTVTDKTSYDMADAFVIARARWIENNNKCD